MAKRKMTTLAQVISGLSDLTDNEKQTVADLLRLGKSPSRNGTAPTAAASSRKKSPQKSSAVNTKTAKEDAGSVAEQLAVATGRSVDDAQAALDAADGNKKAALIALTGDGK